MNTHSREIFISYRRDDASAEAHLVHGLLRRQMGEANVFMDVSSIPPGTEWPEKIATNLRTATTVVAVIGPDWLRAGTDDWGRRRIDDESDWVRRELETALQSGKRVIPLLVRGAKVPPDSALPETLRGLFKRQYIEVRRDVWNHDIKLLEDALVVPVAVLAPMAPPPTPKTKASNLSPPEIKRERDLKQLQEVLRWISLGAMDRFLYWLGYNGWLTNEGHFLWERLGRLLENSRFYLSDAELRTRLITFMKAWGKCFTHHMHMDQHRNGTVSIFNVSDFADPKYARDQNQRAKFNGEQAAPLKASFDAFLDYVREHYLEVDLETAGQQGLAEYKVDEAETKELIRLREEADRIP
jgi:hypothetical protein